LAHRRYGDVVDKGGYSVGKISETKRVVVCTMGDGEAMFGNIGSALWSCAHYGIGVVYLILNNACWGIEWPVIERAAKQWAKKASDYEFVDIDNPRIDFEVLARSLGVYSAKADTPRELERGLRKCIALAQKGKPSLLEARMEKYTGPRPSSVP
ncbi:MAG: thiamine pyrophosphate-dependent enzyme, partial [Thermoprotei archaeon]